jgi:hypothetical protein
MVPRQRRLLRAGRIALGVVACACLVHAGPASAGRAVGAAPAALGGFKGSAQADGMHAFYNPNGILPIPPLVDIGAPDALATITSGPLTYARAGTLDPGDLFANPDPLFVAASSDYKPGTIPAYPYRVSATSGVGAPSADSTPAPGREAHVAANLTGSSATATTPKAAAPAILTFGSMSSVASTSTDGSTVTLHSHAEISEVNLLGLVTIESVVTDLAAVTTSEGPAVSGGTTVSGAKVFGQAVTIDENGIAPAPGSTPTTTDPLNGILAGLTSTVTGSLNDVLQAAGIRITVSGPVQSGNDKAAQLTAAGLRIDLELSRETQPALEGLLDNVPLLPIAIPGALSFADLVALAQARHLTYVGMAQGAVVLSTTSPLSHATTPTATGSSAPTASAGTGSTAGSAALPAGSGAAPASGRPEVAGEPASAPVPASFVTGLGPILLLALLALPFVGDRLSRLALEILGEDGMTSCSWEER